MCMYLHRVHLTHMPSMERKESVIGCMVPGFVRRLPRTSIVAVKLERDLKAEIEV